MCVACSLLSLQTQIAARCLYHNTQHNAFSCSELEFFCPLRNTRSTQEFLGSQISGTPGTGEGIAVFLSVQLSLLMQIT